MSSDKKKYFRNSNLDQLIKTIVERVTNTNETRLITKERISRTMLTTYHELRDPACRGGTSLCSLNYPDLSKKVINC